MSNLLTKEFTIFFSPNEYLSDNGILFHSNKKYNFNQFLMILKKTSVFFIDNSLNYKKFKLHKKN